MARAVIAYDKDLPEIPGRRPWEKPTSYLIKDDAAAIGWREETAGRRPSRLLLVPKIRAAVDAWRAGGYEGASEVTRRLFEYWFEEDHEVAGSASPFATTSASARRRHLPPLEAKRTVFNYVATDNDYERRFAVFLDKARDVLRFASLGTTEQGESGTQFRVDYLKPSGAIGFYHPGTGSGLRAQRDSLRRSERGVWGVRRSTGDRQRAASAAGFTPPERAGGLGGATQHRG